MDENLYYIDAGYIESRFACVYLLERGEEYALIETGTNYTLANIRVLMRHCGIEAKQLRYVIPTQFQPTEYLASLQLLDSYEVRRMYLTHSGVMQYSGDMLQRLETQLSCFCVLARQFPDDMSLLAAALEQQLLATGMHLGYRGEVIELRRLLLMDIELNARGLAIWAARQAELGATG